MSSLPTNEPRWCVGMDLSLRCPSVAIVDRETGVTTVLWWTQRKREDVLNVRHTVSKNVWWVRFPTLVETDATGCMGRATQMRNDIASVLSELEPSRTRVQIEGYAFGSSDSGHASRLAELGGVIKSYLFENKFKYAEVPPTSVKKFWSGSGRADKSEMIKTARTKGYPVDEMQTDMLLKEVHDHPLEDIVDAIAIAEFVKHGTKRKRSTKTSTK